MSRAFSMSGERRQSVRLIAGLFPWLLLAGCGGGDGPGPVTMTQSSEVHEDGEDPYDESAQTGMKRALAASLGGGASTSFNGGERAHVEGAFGPQFNWPVMPIHVVSLPDGRVLGYGTDSAGKQGASLHYAVWDPQAGTGTDAFTMLPNVVGTDIFCGGQALLPGSGKVLLVGGDATVNGQRNYATADVNLFDPRTNTLAKASGMKFKRWYATAVTLPDGQQLVLGGRNDKDFAGNAKAPPTVMSYSPVPEIRSADGRWRDLPTVADNYAYGEIGMSWFYPRAWVKPDGKVFILAHNGLSYTLDPSGEGMLTRHAARTNKSRHTLPSVMFAPGKVLSLRQERDAVVVDLNGSGEPTFTATEKVSAVREWGNATVLADGKVWVSGGSGKVNELVDVALHSELWDPATGRWARAASATQPRLYHSTAVLLRDGTVATGGGGSPGPLLQLNGEIYYPPYLFNRDGSGNFFNRPSITEAPTTVLGWNQSFTIKVSSPNITRATLVRSGSITHSFDSDTRFFELPTTQTGYAVALTTPANANVAPPGYYLLFAWNKWGVPSVAAVLRIGA